MFFSWEKVLTSGQLKRLAEHKYSSEGRSVLDALFQPWWNFLVSRTPIWLAPNLITVIGLITNVVTSLLLVYYSPDAKSDAPWWVFILCALGLFIYQSLDAIDGKQARRTNTSSPLGELFDHGCDSVSTVFVALSACIAVGLGEYPSWMFFQCFAAVTLFYCAHWQAYVSGTLKFGRVDVTEAQLTIIGIHLISAALGTSFWATKMHPIDILECRHSMLLMTVAGGSVALYELFMLLCRGGVGKNGSTVAIPMVGASLRECMTYVFATAYLRTFVEFCPVLWVGGAGKNGSTIAILNLEFKQWEVIFGSLIGIYLLQRTLAVILTGGVGKNGSSVAGTSVLSPVIPLSLVVMPAYIIYRKSTNGIYENNPVLYILSFGLVGAKVTNRLVVAHMTRNEMDYLDSSLVGPAMLFLNQYFNFFIDEYYVLWLSMLWVTFDLIKYCTQVCLEICDHMHIQLFKITPSVIPQTAANKNVNPEDVLDVTLSLEEDLAPLLEQDDDDVVLYNASSDPVII